MPAEPAPPPGARILIHYSPANRERMREAGRILRQLFARVAHEYGYPCHHGDPAPADPQEAPPTAPPPRRPRPRRPGGGGRPSGG